MLFLDQIIFETKQKSKYKVDFKLFFISIENKIFWKYPKFFGENPGKPIKNLEYTCYNVQLI